MNVWLFGNPDLAMDSLPLRLQNRLELAFPAITFTAMDPLDEWNLVPDPLVVIDTVAGIKQVTTFNSLEQFQHESRVTLHDYDLGMQLSFLHKLGKLPKLTIIGIPPTLTLDEAFQQVADVLHALIHHDVDHEKE